MNKTKLQKLMAVIIAFAMVFTGALPVFASEEIADVDVALAEVETEVMGVTMPLFYNKVTFGATSADRVLDGKMNYYMHVSDDAPIEKKDDNLWYAKSGCGSDALGNHAVAPDGTSAYFITKYMRSDKNENAPGNLYFEMGDDITTEDKELYVFVDVYGTDVTNVSLEYNADESSNHTKIQNSSATKTVDGEWTTLMFYIPDAYFNGEANTRFTSKGLADFRIEANSVDTYVRSVAVSNSASAFDLVSAKESLELEDVSNLSESFELPQIDGVKIEWTSTNENAVIIDDGFAIVVPGTTKQDAILIAKIIKDGAYVEKEFVVSVSKEQTGPDLSDAKKLIYNKYTFDTTMDRDVVIGDMIRFSSTLSEQPLQFKDGEWKDLDNRAVDSLCNYAVAPDGTPSLFTTKYLRSTGTYSGGFIYFNMGEDVTVEDKDLYVEAKVYGDGSKMSLLYVNKDNPADRAEIANSQAEKVKDGDWTTITFHVTDAAFNGVSNTGLADQKSDFRLQANSVDTYVKSVSVYNSSDYEELLDIKQNFELENTEDIELSFELPVVDGCEIQWTSSDDETIYVEDNMAIIVPAFEKKKATLTAKIAKDGYYIEKNFEITLAAMEKTAVAFGEPQVEINDGKATATVEVIDANYYAKDIYLYVIAKDKLTGKLSAIGYDYIEQGTVTDGELMATVNVGANDEVKCVLLNEDGVNLENHAPSKVKDVTVSHSFDDVTLKWGSAYDDYNFVAGYVVKENGEAVYNSEQELEFTYPVEPGKDYNFEIVAFDHQNYASKPYEVNFKLPKYARINLGKHASDFDGITLYYNGVTESDTNYEEAKMDGVACVKTFDRSLVSATKTGRTFLYFKVDEDVVSVDNRKVCFEITYYDYGDANLVIMYNHEDGTPGKEYKMPMKGLNQWTTVTFTLEDVKFVENVNLASCDFRLGSGNNQDLYVSNVRVIAVD